MFKNMKKRYEGKVNLNFQQAESEGKLNEKAWDKIADEATQKIMFKGIVSGILFFVVGFVSFVLINTFSIGSQGVWDVILLIAIFSFIIPMIGSILLMSVIYEEMRFINPYKVKRG